MTPPGSQDPPVLAPVPLFEHLCDSAAFPDALQTRSDSIPIHRFVLQARIVFFTQYFDHPTPLPLSREAAHALVDWCYRGAATLAVPICCELLAFFQEHAITEPVDYVRQTCSYETWTLFDAHALAPIVPPLVDFFRFDYHRRQYASLFDAVCPYLMHHCIEAGSPADIAPVFPYVLLNVHAHLTIPVFEPPKPKHITVVPGRANTKLIPMSRANASELSKLMTWCVKQNESLAFRAPVDPILQNAPTYYDIITNPMDLGTIRKRLREKKYKSVNEVLDDVELIWTNAFTYNSPGSEVYTLAEKMAAMFKKKLASIEFDSN